MAIFTLTAQEWEFGERPFVQHHVRLEPAVSCDGGRCGAPWTMLVGLNPDEVPAMPHWHLVLSAPDLQVTQEVYIDLCDCGEGR